MAMDPREYELIALGHVLARYRMRGQLPNIEGKPFDLNEFKTRLFTGVDTDTDIDVAIIKNTIINEDDDDTPSTAPRAEAPEQSNVVPNQNEVQEDKSEEPTELPQEDNKGTQPQNPLFGGKLFQFFNKDNK